MHSAAPDRCCRVPAVRENMPIANEIARAFALFDRDGDGFLTPAELKAILCRPVVDGTALLRAEQVEQIMTKSDANTEGKLSVEELTKAWSDSDLQRAVPLELYYLVRVRVGGGFRLLRKCCCCVALQLGALGLDCCC